MTGTRAKSRPPRRRHSLAQRPGARARWLPPARCASSNNNWNLWRGNCTWLPRLCNRRIKERVMSELQTVTSDHAAPQAALVSELRIIFGQVLGVEPAQVAIDVNFLEMGAESLLLMQASRRIEERFGHKVPFRLLIDQLVTVGALADYLVQQGVALEPPADELAGARPPAPTPGPLQAISSTVYDEGTPGTMGMETTSAARFDGSGEGPIGIEDVARVLPADLASASDVERIVARQLQLMAQQLELLRGGGQRPTKPSRPVRAASTVGAESTPEKAQDKQDKLKDEFVAYHPVQKGRPGGLSERQYRHLQDLISRLCERTQGSKQYAQDYRPYLADNRAVAGFRLAWKELCYLPVVARGDGSRIWDVDGNEYVDLTMGFGALFFGHTPAFIIDALAQEIQLGMRLGPQSAMAGQVAQLLCELTGTDRAVFCNSGTEAVMAALRVARAVTGRHRVAMFPGSFHGTFDGTLVRGEVTADGQLEAAPMAPGVTPNMVKDVLLLPYDSPESIEIVRAHGPELAAVLLEPTRSRSPNMQPVDFLRGLREATQDSDTALIFDEVVTGFRMHPGGAQALFGVMADLVTYGKAITGGIPIGVVAGKRRYMDALDGGMWQYGDDSYPEAELTFFAGTFCKHPLAMSAAWAVLNYLKDEGPALQERLGERTVQLAAQLNDYFKAEDVPMQIVHFGSLFRFLPEPGFRFMDIFFFHLLEKGIYIWEGRNCFLGTAHTEEDLDLFVQAVQESVADMRAGGFFPSASASDERGTAQASRTFPLTEAQKHLWIVTQLSEEASVAYNQSLTLEIRGPLDLAALRAALQQVVDRHEALRTTFGPDGDCQVVFPLRPLDVELLDFSDLPEEARQARLDAWMAQEIRRPFDLVQGPLVRVHVVKLGPAEHHLVLTLHHLVTDGKSIGTILGETRALYADQVTGQPIELPPPVPFSAYVDWLSHPQQQEAAQAARAYWLERFAGPSSALPFLELPTDHPRRPLQTFAGSRERATLPAALRQALRQVGAQRGCTLYVTLLAAFQALLHRLTGQEDVIVGVPVAGQLAMGADHLVGYCLNVLP
ncbi:MAG TPA: aminotransferase class III-fold pyridoxal phosphate-dependent enzyme, partial [Phycisphaerales bacterium]|nr:aminotransferase class III-fold pyridoxal phosphate-dependent enzyme [Phycisphaerales bacterium]